MTTLIIITSLGELLMVGLLALYLRAGLTRMEESLQAIMQGQEHIAELTAEVLRRVPPQL